MECLDADCWGFIADVAKQAGHLKQLRIAVASDIHLGTLVGRRHLSLLVKRINKMEEEYRIIAR